MTWFVWGHSFIQDPYEAAKCTSHRAVWKAVVEDIEFRERHLQLDTDGLQRQKEILQSACSGFSLLRFAGYCDIESDMLEFEAYRIEAAKHYLERRRAIYKPPVDACNRNGYWECSAIRF